jgi:hypothetical protein
MPLLLALMLTLLAAGARADVFLRDDIIVDPAPELLTACYDNGCRSLGFVSLTPRQWSELRAAFFPLALDAAGERERLRAAVALMERFVGAATGTWQDKGRTFNSGAGQMDCIDESINTTLYLTLFQKYGLMRHHRVADRATRGWFILGWPHTTAVVTETGSDARWAVDSWFLDNGEPPFILPLDVWRDGWEPEKKQ